MRMSQSGKWHLMELEAYNWSYAMEKTLVIHCSRHDALIPKVVKASPYWFPRLVRGLLAIPKAPLIFPVESQVSLAPNSLKSQSDHHSPVATTTSNNYCTSHKHCSSSTCYYTCWDIHKVNDYRLLLLLLMLLCYKWPRFTFLLWAFNFTTILCLPIPIH